MIRILIYVCVCFISFSSLAAWIVKFIEVSFSHYLFFIRRPAVRFRMLIVNFVVDFFFVEN